MLIFTVHTLDGATHTVTADHVMAGDGVIRFYNGNMHDAHQFFSLTNVIRVVRK